MPLLKQFKTRFGPIRILRDRAGNVAYYQNGSFHSQANRHGVSLCAYVHVIHEIIRQSHARHILVIGCAGGTLATMLRKLHCKVTVVDINFRAFVIARQFFNLPEDVRCVRRDGIAYLRTSRKKYDAVVVDVFGGDNGVPAPFTTAGFFALVQRVLAPAGLMLMNVITADDKDGRADAIARNAQAAAMDITLFDWPGERDRNTLLVGHLQHQIHIPSGAEPRWIKSDLRGLIRRRPHRHAFTPKT